MRGQKRICGSEQVVFLPIAGGTGVAGEPSAERDDVTSSRRIRKRRQPTPEPVQSALWLP